MKSRRIHWIVGMMIGVSLFLCQSIGSTANAQVIQMRLAHYVDDKHPLHEGAKQFVAKVEERTKGQYENYVKACATAQIPFVFDDYDHAHRTLDGPAMQWLAPQFEKAGLIHLANWEWGFRNVTNNKKPIMKPEDIKGLKIRVPPEFHLQTLFESLGAVVTKIAWPELYMALAQNVADGQENPLSAIWYQKFYEVQKHVALTQHAYACAMPMMSTKSWSKLNADQQKIVREEAKRSGDWVRKTLNDEETDLIGKFEKGGLKVTRPDIKAFRAVMGPAYKKIFERYGEDNVKVFMKYVEEARKK